MRTMYCWAEVILVAWMMVNSTAAGVASRSSAIDHRGEVRYLKDKDGFVRCATADPTPKQLERDEVKLGALKDLFAGGGTTGEDNNRRSLFFTEQPVVIDTYAHIIHASDGTGDITDAVMDQQMKVLNEGFSTTSFQFSLIQINRVVNDTLFALGGNAPEIDYKPALHVGDSSTLNLYFVNLAKEEKTPLGFATFPFWYTYAPELDGVVNDFRTAPGGKYDSYNEGKTATHEVGHWMGLYHTFGLEGSCTGPGDFISDTSAHSAPTGGCGADADLSTCPGESSDHSNNFMDYSYDVCLTNFSPGQSERMYLHWLLYRKQDEACPSGEALFELDIELDSYPQELSWSLVTAAGDDIFISPELGVEYKKAPIASAGILYAKDICIPSGSYSFTFSDQYGDGLTEGGSYTITVQGNIVKQGDNFGFSDVTDFDVDAGTEPPQTSQPTVAPVDVAPTLAPVVATLAPAAPVAPGSTVEVTIVIALDLYPEEIGWSLECGGELFADVPNGTYTFDEFSNSTTTALFNVPFGEMCMFLIVDSYGDGLSCFGDGVCGFYGIVIDGSVIVPGTLWFNSSVVETFLAQPAPETQTPTMAPSFVPSTSTVPTTTAAPSAVTVSVSIGVVFDEYPEEIGLLLSCDGIVIAEAPAGSLAGLETVSETFDLPRGATCTFTITDNFGDGLFCFGAGECGIYAVLYGSDPSIGANVIALSTLDDAEDVVTFVVAGAPLTDAPSLGPTVAPSISLAPSGLPSTSMPTVTASPSFDTVAVTVHVLFDEFPSETGIELNCGGESLIDFPATTFGEELALTIFQETMMVKAGSECTFLLTDSFGDGLCARFAECGSYELDVGDALIDSGSEFTEQVMVRFLAGIAQAPSAITPPPTFPPMIDTDVPTVATTPTESSAPVAAPTDVPVSTTPAPVAPAPTNVPVSTTPAPVATAPTDVPVNTTTPAPVATAPTDVPVNTTTPAPVEATPPPIETTPTNPPSSAFARTLSLAFPLFIGAFTLLASL